MHKLKMIFGGVLTLVLVAGCAGSRRWERRVTPAEQILPEVSLRNPDTAAQVLERVRQADPRLTEEDLMAHLLVLLARDAYWMNVASDHADLGLCRRILEAVLKHPNWSHRYDGWLKCYVATLPGEDDHLSAAFARTYFGLPAKRPARGRAAARECPLDGTWLDWLRPASRTLYDGLVWKNGLGRFKEPPAYALPVKGEILRVLHASERGPGLILTFKTAKDLQEAVIALNGGLDARLYDAVPNLFYLPGADVPECHMLTYEDPENACYLMSISMTWTWDKSSWHYLPDDVVPPGDKKGRGRR